MKSGKSLELIAAVAPYKFSDVTVGFYQPGRNVRDEHVESRSGVKAEATKVKSLMEVKNSPQVIGIDEIHMFERNDIEQISKWLSEGKLIYISGLDTDYTGSLIDVVQKLIELKPDTITTKKAVCDVCLSYDAVYTQILKGKSCVTGGLPSVVPDDGTYTYEARCRKCFVRA